MRYHPHSAADREFMLQKIGAANINELFGDIPANVLLKGDVGLPAHASEMSVERQLSSIAAQNVAAGSVAFFCGAGAYKHHVPAIVDHLIQRSEFLTSYTPYQPEISQGTLQYLFEFQTQVALLTGMDVANASMYDGSTAAAEAVLMAHRITKKRKCLVSGSLHPHYADVIETNANLTGDECVRLPADARNVEDIIAQLDESLSCIVIQTPSFFGHLIDLQPIADAAHAKGIIVIAVFTEVVSLGLLQSPGAMGADIVVGEGQSIGNALNFGGPYLGLFATKEKYVRQMPGRLCGETVDANANRGFVLTLSTREQHIRRDKATSNICTNSGLCALAFTIHITLLGEKGLQKMARLNHAKAIELRDALNAVKGLEILNATFFNEFSIALPKPAAQVVEALSSRNILGGVPASRLFPNEPSLQNILILAATEITTSDDIAALTTALKEVL